MARRRMKKKTKPAAIHLTRDGANLCRVDGPSTSARRTMTCEECDAINETRSICADEGEPLKECGCPNGSPLRARWDMENRHWVIHCVPCLDTTWHGLPRFVTEEPWQKTNPLHATYAKAAGLSLYDYHRIMDASIDAHDQAEDDAQAPILVGCCGPKTKNGGQADTVYVSPLFHKALRHARRLSRMTNPPRPIRIVSAFYGLLTLDAHIDPYDLRLSDLSADERAAWTAKVEAQWRNDFPDVYSGTALCGASYVEAMPHGLEFDEPLEGLGVGDRLKWLNAQHDYHAQNSIPEPEDPRAECSQPSCTRALPERQDDPESDDPRCVECRKVDQPGDDAADVTTPETSNTPPRPRVGDVAACAATLAHHFPVPEADKKRAAKRPAAKIGALDSPQPNVVYRLTGTSDEASIARGDSWAASALPADWADQAPEEIGTTADHETTYETDDSHGPHVLDVDQAQALDDLFSNMHNEEWT